MTFPDEHILERRLKQLHKLPKVMPASIILEMTASDFDVLDMAQNELVWWASLNCIVIRITNDNEK